MSTRAWVAAVAIAVLIAGFAGALSTAHWKSDGVSLMTIAAGLAAIGQAVFAAAALLGLRHAQTQADAAAATLQEARIGNEMGLRAYVGLDTATLSFPDLPGEDLVVSITLKNYGQTPGLNVTAIVAMAVGPRWSAPTFKDPNPYLREEHKVVIHPTEPMRINVASNRPVPEADWHALSAGSALFYVMVTVTYDTFGQKRELTLILYADANASGGLTTLWSRPDGYRGT